MAKQAVKKRWYIITAPTMFNEHPIGETPAVEPKELVGKVMRANLATLTDDIKKQSYEISLLFDSVEGDRVKTSMVGLKVVPTSIKRLVRKGRTRLDQTISTITNDEKVVTIKTLVIPRNIVKGSVSRATQTEIRRFIIKKTSSLSFQQLCEEIVDGKLQSELRGRLNKIYPVKICDMKDFQLERSLKATELRRIKADMTKEKKKGLMHVEPAAEEGQEENQADMQEPSEETQEETTEESSETQEETSEESGEEPKEDSAEQEN